MMDYRIFKDVVAEKFLSYMPEQYQGMEIRINSVEKVNRKMDALSLWKKEGEEKEKIVSPSIYINNIYQDYLENGDLQMALQNAAEAMDEVFQRGVEVPKMDIRTAKDNIIFQLVNTMQNEEMLKNMPHREFQDLSVIYQWVVDMDDKAVYAIAVHNNLAKELGMDEEQLFHAAAQNTRRILPPVVKSMNEALRDMLIKDGMPLSKADLIIEEMPPQQTLWIISNERGIDGAASMLYEDKLQKLAESLGTDLYIMPSSVHEVIAVSVVMGEPEELARIVSEANMDQIELGERLSNQVYHYDKDLRKITLATDTPNKRLDGVVAEQGHVYEANQSR